MWTQIYREVATQLSQKRKTEQAAVKMKQIWYHRYQPNHKWHIFTQIVMLHPTLCSNSKGVKVGFWWSAIYMQYLAFVVHQNWVWFLLHMLNVVVLGVYNIFWKNYRYQKMHQILADKYMEITTVSESQYRDIFPVISKNIDILYTPEVAAVRLTQALTLNFLSSPNKLKEFVCSTKSPASYLRDIESAALCVGRLHSNWAYPVTQVTSSSADC